MCQICNSQPNCPVCSPKEYPEACPICDGDGALYLTESEGRVTYEKWAQTADGERDMDVCEHCNGEGIIYK